MIELKKVNKKIKNKEVLVDVNCTFEDGKIYGLYGHNGSGKTMLLRAISGLIVQDSGEIIINGKLLHSDMDYPENIGIVIEHMELLPNYNAFDNLKLLSKVKKSATDEDIRKTIERVGLKTEEKVKKYSLGMKQRLNIAQAIFEKQDIILLDEPTNAIDDDGVDKMCRILEEEKKRGATIIITTHSKEFLDKICDEVYRMNDGRIKKDERNKTDCKTVKNEGENER